MDAHYCSTSQLQNLQQIWIIRIPDIYNNIISCILTRFYVGAVFLALHYYNNLLHFTGV